MTSRNQREGHYAGCYGNLHFRTRARELGFKKIKIPHSYEATYEGIERLKKLRRNQEIT